MRIHEREMHDWERLKLGPPPDARPDNDSALAMVYAALQDLDSERPMGPRYRLDIPFSSLVLWAEVYGLDLDLFDLLKSTVALMDEERMEDLRSKFPPPKGTRR